MQRDNTVALLHLVKVRGTQNKVLSTLSKEMWYYFLNKGIMIISEYLPGALNKEVDFQLRTVKDANEWKLSQVVFQKICGL